MSNLTNIQLLFEEMADAARATNCSAFEDLPPLICDHCSKLSSLGGSKTFEEGNFTPHVICICSIISEG